MKDADVEIENNTYIDDNTAEVANDSNEEAISETSRKLTCHIGKANHADLINNLAMVPALSMLVITFAILVMDVTMRSMMTGQYDMYMKMWHISVGVSVVCGLIFLYDRYKKGTFIHTDKNDMVAGYAAMAGNAENNENTIEIVSGIKGAYNKAKTEFLSWYHRLDKADKLQFGFVICMIVSTIENGFGHEALYGIPYRSLGVLHFIALIVVYTICSAHICRASSRYLFLNLFLMLSDLLAIGLFYDNHFLSFPAFRDDRTNSTIFFNSNHYAYFLTMAVLIAAGYYLYAEKDLRTFGIVSLMLNLSALAVNRSMGAIIAVTVVIVMACVQAVWNWHKEPIKDLEIQKKENRDDSSIKQVKAKRARYGRATMLLYVLIAGAVLALAFIPSIRVDAIVLVRDFSRVITGQDDGHAGSGRWILWVETAKYIKENPILGWGCEGIAHRLLSETGMGSPHFEILTYAAFFGIPAAVFYTVWVVKVLVRSWKRGAEDVSRMTACLAATGYFISSMFGIPIFYTLPFFFIFLGMGDDICSGCIKDALNLKSGLKKSNGKLLKYQQY